MGLRRLAVDVGDASDAIAVQALDGRILAWNPAAERLYGWSEAEALGMTMRELIPASLQAEALVKTEALGRAELLAPYRTQRVSKGGQVIDLTLVASALVNEAP